MRVVSTTSVSTTSDEAARRVREVGAFLQENAEAIAGEFEYPYVAEDGLVIRVRGLCDMEEIATVEVEKHLLLVGRGDSAMGSTDGR